MLDHLTSRIGVPGAVAIRRAAEVVLALLIAAQAVRLAVILFGAGEPPEVVRAAPSQPADLTILSRFDPFHRDEVEAEPLTGAAPGLRLFGVRTGPAGGAIIAGADGVQKSYAVGQEVQPGLSLFSVGADHVVLRRAGVNSRLHFDNQVPPAALQPPPPPPVPQVTR